MKHIFLFPHNMGFFRRRISLADTWFVLTPWTCSRICFEDSAVPELGGAPDVIRGIPIVYIIHQSLNAYASCSAVVTQYYKPTWPFTAWIDSRCCAVPWAFLRILLIWNPSQHTFKSLPWIFVTRRPCKWPCKWNLSCEIWIRWCTRWKLKLGASHS